ncbi:hypothetical protein FBUS_09959 [Fasciolopsis buskii]|uniref:Uncharacterized protein n=1 Tax=Fasciolopsis buskii TaxID=27845 RepID=A0A8E0S3R3_9TREM|nr:hypothetical protein FBUS_09959 [Fasciolopsis buski]
MPEHRTRSPALEALLWCMLLSNGLIGITCVPLTDWSEQPSTSDLADDEARVAEAELENKLGSNALHQIARANVLEQAAQQAAFKARALKQKAKEAEFRALEAVAEGQSIAERERQIKAMARIRQGPLKPMGNTPIGLDTLMEKDPLMVHKRSPLVRGSNGQSSLGKSGEADPLEALRLLYLQMLLSNRDQPKSEVPKILGSSDRLVLVPSPRVLLGGASESESQNEPVTFGELRSIENPYLLGNHVDLPARFRTSLVNADDGDNEVGAGDVNQSDLFEV